MQYQSYSGYLFCFYLVRFSAMYIHCQGGIMIIGKIIDRKFIAQIYLRRWIIGQLFYRLSQFLSGMNIQNINMNKRTTLAKILRKVFVRYPRISFSLQNKLWHFVLGKGDRNGPDFNRAVYLVSRDIRPPGITSRPHYNLGIILVTSSSTERLLYNITSSPKGPGPWLSL